MTSRVHPLPRHRFPRRDYQRMAESGILGDDARVELLDGEVVEKCPIGPRHDAVVDRLTEFFVRSAAGKCICRVQGSIALVGESEPEPDIVLLRPRDDFYASALPTPDDVLLIIEVAESSRDLDLGMKAQLYAASGVQEYWVFDLSSNEAVVHRDATAGGYASVTRYDQKTTFSPSTIPALSQNIAAILPS